MLGGGVAGVTVARTLSERGVEVALFESSPRLGGLHRSVAIEGVHYDIGAFFFDDEHDFFVTFSELRPRFVAVPLRQAALTPEGRLGSYPPSVLEYAREHGPACATT